MRTPRTTLAVAGLINAGLLSGFVTSGVAHADLDGCHKDIECKGDWICVDGGCVDPRSAGVSASAADVDTEARLQPASALEPSVEPQSPPEAPNMASVESTQVSEVSSTADTGTSAEPAPAAQEPKSLNPCDLSVSSFASISTTGSADIGIGATLGLGFHYEPAKVFQFVGGLDIRQDMPTGAYMGIGVRQDESYGAAMVRASVGAYPWFYSGQTAWSALARADALWRVGSAAFLGMKLDWHVFENNVHMFGLGLAAGV